MEFLKEMKFGTRIA